MPELRVLSFVFFTGAAAAQSVPLTPPANVQDNGTIAVGRDPLAGGSLTWLVDRTKTPSDMNLINDRGFGSQGQSAMFDSKCWNPTQAGDGNYPSISDLFYVGPAYVYSKCTPLLFYNDGAPLTAVVRAASDYQYYQWSEFMSDPHAFTLKTVFRNTCPLVGDVQPEQIIPNIDCDWVLRDGTEFSKMWAYTGVNPWSSTLDTNISDVTDICTHDYVSEQILMTENWMSLTDSTNWGVSVMSTSSLGYTLFCGPVGPGHPNLFGCPNDGGCPDDGSVDDHQNPLRSIDHVEVFAPGVEPGQSEQLREGRVICYVGDRDAARTFFAGFAPQLSGAFRDDFTTDFRNWDLNSYPISMASGTVTMGPAVPRNNWGAFACPTTQEPDDMSLVGKVYGDALFTVRMKYLSGHAGNYGMAIRKAGQQHWSASATGYYSITLNDSGTLTISNPGRGDGGSWNLTSTQYHQNDYNTLMVLACGPDIKVALGGVNDLDHTSWVYHDQNPQGATCKQGYFSLFCDTGDTVAFDSVEITPGTNCTTSEVFDSTPPSAVTNLALSTSTVPGKLTLTWTNPTESDWLWTRVVRNTTATPTHWRDGLCVYEGRQSTYTDADVYDTSPSTNYYYAVFTVDRAGNYSPNASAVSGAPTGSQTLKIRTIVSNAGDDGYITTDSPGLINSSGTTLTIGDTAGNHSSTAILSFDTSSIPTTAFIQTAKLKCKCSSVQNNPDRLGYPQVDVKKGFFGTHSLEAGDVTATASARNVAPLWNPEKSGLTACALLNASGVGNINAGGWTQFRLSYAAVYGDNQADSVSFYSGNSIAANQPVLEIVYQ